MTQGPVCISLETKKEQDVACHYSAFLIESREKLEQLAPEWNTLLRRSEADTIFLTWEWITSWLDTIDPKTSLMVAIVKDADQKLVAVAPFYRSRLNLFGWIPYQCLRILGDCNSGAEYPDIIVESGLEDKTIPLIAEIYKEHAKKWDWVWLLNIAGWTGALERLVMAFHPTANIIKQSPYSFSSISFPKSWDKFIALVPKSKTRILKRQQRILTQHSPEFLRCQRVEELSTCLDDFFILHKKRWQSIGQKGSFNRWPRMDEFYRDFAQKAIINGWLGFFFLSLNGVVCASQYGYVYNNVYHVMQEGFDPDGPPGQGNVLRKEVINWCIKEEIQDYDFLGGYSKHKESWGANERWGWRLFLGRRCLKNMPIKLTRIWPSGRFIQPEKH